MDAKHEGLSTLITLEAEEIDTISAGGAVTYPEGISGLCDSLVVTGNLIDEYPRASLLDSGDLYVLVPRNLILPWTIPRGAIGASTDNLNHQDILRRHYGIRSKPGMRTFRSSGGNIAIRGAWQEAPACPPDSTV